MRLPESPSLRPTPSVCGIPAAGAVIADDAETGGNTAAQRLKGQLQAELAEWRVLHHKLASSWNNDFRTPGCFRATLAIMHGSPGSPACHETHGPPDMSYSSLVVESR